MSASVPNSNFPDDPESTPSYWRTQEMLLLQYVMAQIGKGLALDQQLREMLHLLSETLGLNRGRIVLRDGDTDTYRIVHSYGLTREEVARGRYVLGEGITGRSLENRQLIIVQDIDKEPTFLARAVERERLPPGTVAFITVPINVGSATIGVLACHRIRHRNRPLSDDTTILKMLATLIGQLLQLKASLEEKTRALEQHNQHLARALESATVRYGIIGTSPTLLRAISQLEQVSAANASVLLLGASGTGKEMFARALHLASPRRDAPFIKVNCAAIPDTLFESELFGHEKGAFTGAASERPGWFEQADTGTIFLDEIGEMPLSMQTKLLRTLQEGTVTRLGAKREIKIDVRLVAATNRDLSREVTAGRFRQDLFYRLNVIPIRLPSLRERIGDVPQLAAHFLTRFNQTNQRNVNLTPSAIERLKNHDWPGNIRQLANMIERMVLLADQALLDDRDLDVFLAGDDHDEPAPTEHRAAPAILTVPEPSPYVRPYAMASSHSYEELVRALEASWGNKSRAAQLLGLTERQFSYRWKRHKL